MRIEELNLSVRAFNCLKSAGVYTIDDMAMIDLDSLKNCGVKTKNEIKNKISELKEQKYYSDEFIEKYLSDEENHFIDNLPLSVRSKNILKSISITNSGQLVNLNEDILYEVRNAGKSSVEEIMNYINSNRDFLIKESLTGGINEYNFVLDSYTNFSGNVLLNCIPMSKLLLEELENNNIYNLCELIVKKVNVSKQNETEYLKLYEYFHNMAYGNLVLTYSNVIGSCFVKMPFSLRDYQENDNVKVSVLANYIINNFSLFSIEEMINAKLYLNWLNTQCIDDMEEYYFEKLDLSDKQEAIISRRTYMTLEEIGKIFNVTRERIRQIESKVNKKIESIIKNIPFIILDLTKIYEVSSMTDRELFLIYIDEKIYSNFFSIKDGERILFVPKYHLNKINKLLEDDDLGFELNGFINYDDESYPEILKYTLRYLELNIHNYKISKKMTKRQQVKYAMRYMGRPVSISNLNDLDEISTVVYDLFGVDLDCNARALETIIGDVGVRVDSGTYCADDSVIPLDSEILDDIVDYVKLKEIINTRDLFVKFGNVFYKHNITNEVMLYRYLKDELNGKLYFHGVSAVISADESLSCWGDVVIRDINRTNKPINKLDFVVKYSITDSVYQSLSVNFSDIIVWSNKELFLKSKISINEKLKRKFIYFLEEKQITSFEEIKNYLKNEQEDLLMVNNINNNVNLYYFLCNILPDDFFVDKEKNEVRKKRTQSRVIEKTYDKIEELTL